MQSSKILEAPKPVPGENTMNRTARELSCSKFGLEDGSCKTASELSKSATQSGSITTDKNLAEAHELEQEKARLESELASKKSEFEEIQKTVLQIKTIEVPEVERKMKTTLYAESERRNDLVGLDTRISD